MVILRHWILAGMALSFSVNAAHAATLSISANPASVTSGASSTLTWTSTEATSCAASGAWSGVKATSGSQSVIAPNGLNSYALNCSGPSGSASNSVVIGAGTTPPALYALNVTLSGSGTVTSNPSGIACGATCSASYPSGAAVTLSATPATGYTFSGWSGACAGTNLVCNVAMSSVLAVTATFSTSGSVLFQDDFESGNLSKTQGGARWGGSTSAQVVNVRPNTGTYSLRMTFSGVPDGEDSFSEQRFELGGRYTDVWIKYDLYIPSNYYHRTQNPDSANNKSFVHLWAGDYSGGPGFGAGYEIWPDGTGAGNLAFHPFRPDQGHLDDNLRNSRGIELSDRGTWIEITSQIKNATSANNDGEARVWKRRQGSTTKELIYEQTGLPIYNADGNFMERGYLLGWSNSGFLETTVFYIDNFVISNNPLP